LLLPLIHYVTFLLSISSGFGPGMCGIPIGFGFTTTVGGLNPFTDDIYGGSLAYGPSYGLTASGVPQRGFGGVSSAFNRGPPNRGGFRPQF
jgi:hypothetical protein